jgi:predicted benzoate:H+ symporter BenE
MHNALVSTPGCSICGLSLPISLLVSLLANLAVLGVHSVLVHGIRRDTQSEAKLVVVEVLVAGLSAPPRRAGSQVDVMDVASEVCAEG